MTLRTQIFYLKNERFDAPANLDVWGLLNLHFGRSHTIMKKDPQDTAFQLKIERVLMPPEHLNMWQIRRDG